jgi:hypothetical protein
MPSFLGDDWMRSAPPGVVFGLEMVMGTITLVFLSILLPKWLPSIRTNQSIMPVSWRSTFVLVLIFLCIVVPIVAGPLYPNAARRFWKWVRGDEDRLLQRDSAGWHEVELPGIPYEIQTSSEGDVWVATQDPSGLSRWSGGHWSHYPRSDGRSGGFAVSGKQVWAASDSGLDRFDGQKWQRVPAAVVEPMATAAEGNEVWVINGSGMLTHCAADECQTRSVTNQIP